MVSASLACLCSDSVVYQIDILGERHFSMQGKYMKDHESTMCTHVHFCLALWKEAEVFFQLSFARQGEMRGFALRRSDDSEFPNKASKTFIRFHTIS